jgi:plastocyanin
MPNTTRTRSLLVAAAAVVLVASLSLGLNAVGGISPVLAKDQVVKIVDFGFEPATITIPQYTSVTWEQTGSAEHTVTADDGSFDSGNLAKGDVFTNLFEVAGTYQYHCAIHPDRMKGTVVVTSAASPPPPSGPTHPPGTLPPNFSPAQPDQPSESASEAIPSASAAPSPPSTTGNAAPVLGVIAMLVVVIAVAVLLVRRRGRASH